MSIVLEKPIELVDTTNIPEKEWHEWRKKGIGGSDVAALMGLSPFQTARDLYYTKIGRKPAFEEESNVVAKEVGHRLESLVAQIFTMKTGLKHYAKSRMFAHPKYSFMQANLDYFVTLPDGREAILECKTTNHHAIDKWGDDTIPINYELQIRHYMAVMNIEVAFIACLYGNNEGMFIWRRIERDLEFENQIIESELQFWNDYVQAGVAPPYTENSELVLASIRKAYGLANESDDDVKLDKSMMSNIRKYLEISEQKSLLRKQVDLLDDSAKKTIAPVLEKIGAAYQGICEAKDEAYCVSYKPIYKSEVDLDGLKAQYPDIYNQFVSKPESYRRLSIKKIKVGA